MLKRHNRAVSREYSGSIEIEKKNRQPNLSISKHSGTISRILRNDISLRDLILIYVKEVSLKDIKSSSSFIK